MIYANTEERSRLIAGLREVADFLEARQEVPAPRWADLTVFPSADTDSEMQEQVDGIAAFIGSEIDDQTAGYGHYTTSREFGPVQYRAVAIPARSREYRAACMSYSENIRPLIDGEA